MVKYTVDSDIHKAYTLPSTYYQDNDSFNRSKEKIFASTWQYICDIEDVKVPGQVTPIKMLENFLDEPLVLTRDFNDKIHFLSNVCTHRGMLVCENQDKLRTLRCRYHGRKFKMDGKFESMPEYEGVEGFPSDSDDLPKINFHILGNKFIFASIYSKFGIQDILSEMMSRIEFLPLNEFAFDKSRSRDYLVNCHWALYCDNYLEGFHIPYVHHSLNEVLDYGSYETEIYKFSNLQLGVSKGGELTFDFPKDHQDYGREIAAYYYWVFPNMMFNFYPWGLSINIVQPLAINRTKVSFKTYVWKPELLDKGAGSGLDRVEREDEIVVESVQIGINSRLYNRGRFSPKREKGVHHFHSLLAEFE